MKLFIKQKVWSWKDKFTVLDESGDDRYAVEGEFFSFGKKLHVHDHNGDEVLYIEQELFHWMPCFKVYVGGQEMATVQQKFSWFRPKYEISGPDWTVEGSFWEHEYEVLSEDGCVVHISKELMTWGDSYMLDIAEPENELQALAVVLCIDCAVASRNN